MMDLTLSQTDYDTLTNFVYADDKADTGQSAFPGMTYEQGMLAVLDVIQGNVSAEELTGQ